MVINHIMQALPVSLAINTVILHGQTDNPVVIPDPCDQILNRWPDAIIRQIYLRILTVPVEYLTQHFGTLECKALLPEDQLVPLQTIELLEKSELMLGLQQLNVEVLALGVVQQHAVIVAFGPEDLLQVSGVSVV